MRPYRIKAHRNPFLPDKTHIHYKLLVLGLSQRVAMPTIVGTSLLLTLANCCFSALMPITLLFGVDLADSEICDIFIFKKDPNYAESYLNSQGMTPEYIYDGTTDLTHLMLYGWFENRYSSWHQFGTVVYDPGPHPYLNIDYCILLEYLEEYRANRLMYQYYFRPI